MDNKLRFKILIVDDERLNLIVLNKILEPNYSTFTATNGKMALELTKKIMPDIILLDIIMPGINGFEVITELKRDDSLRKIPVIFITGLDNAEDEEKGFALGAADYITKPFHNALVKARVQTQLQMVEYIHTIEKLSMIDVLTNVKNRRGFNSRTNLEWNYAIREQTPLSILMIDLDNFKNYNDTYGHIQGDIALQTIAEIFKKSMKRSTDLIARFGGEEFTILLPNTNSNGALTVAEEIRFNVENTIITGTNVSMTVSIGVTTKIPSLCDTIEDFISEADKVLYAAKEAGRNRVCNYIRTT